MEDQEIKAKIGECQLQLEQLQARAKQIVDLKSKLTYELIQKAQKPAMPKKK